MTRIGFHASHEQFSPAELLRLARLAEQAGFEMVFSSDHITPWSYTQDDSGFAWAWLGAAMQATNFPFGVVTVPGYRYHPAILTQAVATLSHMFPGRFTLTVGSGEALNEHVIGKTWPLKQKRNAILQESVEIMRRLWNDETVTHHGNIEIDEARLYTLPKEPVRVYGAALTPETARWLGSWADGLITTTGPLHDVKKCIDAFKEGGGEGKPIILKAQLSYDDTYDAALQGAFEQWRFTLLSSKELSELRTPNEFEAAARHITPQVVAEQVIVSDKPEVFIDWIQSLYQFDPEAIILHNVNTNQERFVRWFGKHVLPRLPA